MSEIIEGFEPSNKIKLLPCPFCGSNRVDFWIDGEEGNIYQIVCLGCFNGTDECATREVAIKKWNTRKPMENIVAQLEAEIESSDKYIREYDDSVVQKAFNKGMRDSLRIVKEEGGLNESN